MVEYNRTNPFFKGQLMYMITDGHGLYLTKDDYGWCWTGLALDKSPEIAPYIFTNLNKCIEMLNIDDRTTKIVELTMSFDI